MSKHSDSQKADDYANYRDIMSQKEYEEFMEDYSADTPALLCSANDHTEAARLEALVGGFVCTYMVIFGNTNSVLLSL